MGIEEIQKQRCYFFLFSAFIHWEKFIQIKFEVRCFKCTSYFWLTYSNQIALRYKYLAYYKITWGLGAHLQPNLPKGRS